MVRQFEAAKAGGAGAPVGAGDDDTVDREIVYGHICGYHDAMAECPFELPGEDESLGRLQSARRQFEMMWRLEQQQLAAAEIVEQQFARFQITPLELERDAAATAAAGERKNEPKRSAEEPVEVASGTLTHSH